MNTEKQLLEDRYQLNKQVEKLKEQLLLAEQSQAYMIQKNRELEQQLRYYKDLATQKRIAEHMELNTRRG